MKLNNLFVLCLKTLLFIRLAEGQKSWAEGNCEGSTVGNRSTEFTVAVDGGVEAKKAEARCVEGAKETNCFPAI